MDDEVRLSERAWRASGSVEDHARHLAALVRSGRLPGHRLRLAARLGHAAAGVASGIVAVDGRPIPPLQVDLATAGELRRAGREVRLRLQDLLHDAEPAASVVAALALHDLAPIEGPESSALVARVRGWLGTGDASDLAEALPGTLRRLDAPGPGDVGALDDLGFARHLARLMRRALEAGPAWPATVSYAGKQVIYRLTRDVAAPPAALWEAARAALLAWALGGAA